MTPSQTKEPWVSPGCWRAITKMALRASLFLLRGWQRRRPSMFLLERVLPAVNLVASYLFLLTLSSRYLASLSEV